MPFRTALSGLNASSAELLVIGNNVANASTTGFKESRAEFADLYASSIQDTSSNAAGQGVRVALAHEPDLGDLDVSHGHLRGLVPEQFHQGGHRHTGAGHLGGEGMAQAVAVDAFGGVDVSGEFLDNAVIPCLAEVASEVVDHHQASESRG